MAIATTGISPGETVKCRVRTQSDTDLTYPEEPDNAIVQVRYRDSDRTFDGSISINFSNDADDFVDDNYIVVNKGLVKFTPVPGAFLLVRNNEKTQDIVVIHENNGTGDIA